LESTDFGGETPRLQKLAAGIGSDEQVHPGREGGTAAAQICVSVRHDAAI
jgi:hypothetical protein